MTSNTFQDSFTPVEKHSAEYFGCLIEVWRIKGPIWGAYPWRYAVTHNGKRREYTGVPNYMESKRSALKKAWWRAKWLFDGTYADKYKPEQDIVPPPVSAATGLQIINKSDVSYCATQGDYKFILWVDDEDADGTWFIRLFNMEEGKVFFDGWWQNSIGKSVDEAIEFAESQLEKRLKPLRAMYGT